MPNHSEDYRDLIDFWRTQDLHPVPASEAEIQAFEHTHAITLPPDFLIFCDFLMSCYAYAVRIKGDPSKLGEIVVAGGLRYLPVAPTFRDFIHLYLAGDYRLHDFG